MNRRHFLASTLAASVLPALPLRQRPRGVGFASPAEAIKAPRETTLFTVALHAGTGVDKPDFLATIDADPASPTYSTIIHRLPMPTLGDELHHFGWNICSSCHSDSTLENPERRYLIVPGLKSTNIHIVDAANPAQLRLVKTIDGDEIKRKVNLSTPHTAHCLSDGHILISMLGDAQGNGPGGFLLLDPTFEIAGRWENNLDGMKYNYDFWYQPRHNVMVSTEWAAPNTFWSGFNPADVAAGKYGSQIHFWNWTDRRIAQTISLGDTGLIPLEVRFQHNPDSTHGYVGAALSSTIWHFHKKDADGQWAAAPVIAVDPVKPPGGGEPLPGLITDILISMDDRFLYFSNWLHGDIRQYDITDPAHPRLAGQIFVGGLIGKAPRRDKNPLRGGPQMIQLSLDGKRLYVTNSLLSSWDDQFYPDLATHGSHLLQVDCDTNQGGLTLNDRFYVDFGPARAHEVRYPGGDCSSDIFT